MTESRSTTPFAATVGDLDMTRLTIYAKEALDWPFVEENADLYYQRMFNLAGDVVKLAAKVDEEDA